MVDHKVKRISITDHRLDELARLLRAEVDLPHDLATKDAPEDTAAVPSGGPSVGAHLTDDEFVRYMLETLSADMLGRAHRHTAQCSLCAAEIERLRGLSDVWEDEVAIQRLQRRVRSVVPAPHPLRAAHAGALESIFRIPLQRLLLPQGAFGEGSSDAADPVEFPITEGGREVAELHGSLQRKNREYYVRVSVTRSEDRGAFDHRRVSIVLSDPGRAAPILRRNIDVGVTVLLGTDLRLTEKSYVEAELLQEQKVSKFGDDA